MALIPGLQLPYGIQPVNALPVDSLSGPYEGANAAAAIAAANAAIDVALRFKSLEVRLVYGGTSYKYWYRAGTADGDLELFSSTLTVAAGSDTHIQFNDGGTSFGGDSGLTYNKTTDTLTIAGDLAINGGDLTTSAATFNLLNDTATTVNLAGGASTALNLGHASATNTVLGKTKFSQGLSGSLTKLTDGTSYLLAGSGITISSASNGTITISNDGTVGDITAITAGIGLTGGGTSGSVTLDINDSVVATTSGSTFTGITKHNAGLSGSLTNLVDGSSYIIGGGNVSVSSASNGAITFATINSGTIHGVTAGTGLTGGGASGAVTLNINDSVVATISGSTFTGITKHNAGLSGSLTNLVDGSSYIIGGGNVSVLTGSNGAITLATINSGTIHGVTAGTGLTGGGVSGAVTLNINDSVVATTSGSTFTGAVKFNQGLSGSLTKLTNGDSYLVGATTSTMNQTGSILISSASNGQVTISSYVFPNDLTVSLTNSRTFGRYASGATIPATGKTPAEVILLAIAEPIDPTVSIAGTNPITSTFGISGSINSSITGSYIINTLGGSVSAARLQFRSGSSGNYTILSTSTTSPLNYDHTFEVGAFFTTDLNYQYIITDSGGAYATGSLTLTPQAYSAPSISLTVTTTTPGSVTGETNSKREKGNVGSTITGTITRNRANAPLSSYSVQYQVNGAGAWVDVPGLSSISASGSSVAIPSTSHDDATLKTSTSLVYRVQVVDSFQTTTSSSTTISFLNVIFHAPVATAPTTSANVRAIANKVFTDSANPFNLITSTVENDFAVALPTTSASNDTISNAIDLDALNADITANYVLSTFNVDDAGGTAVSYNVYTLSNATPYTTSHRHQITRA